MEKFTIEWTECVAREPQYQTFETITIEAPTRQAAIRRAKKWAGITGLRCEKVEWMGQVTGLIPRGLGKVLIII